MFLVFATERFEALGSEAKWVGYCYADSASTYV
jgi:hypothetical protein